jgi:cation transport regulator ChaC
MWNPALHVVETCIAKLHGWHRRFCLRLLFGRGTPAEPGAMLALDRGGACRGLLFRIAAAKVPAELRLLWRREMLAGSYDARWVWTAARGKPIRALTFVANRNHERYIGAQPLQHVAELIRKGKGPFGQLARLLRIHGERAGGAGHPRRWHRPIEARHRSGRSASGRKLIFTGVAGRRAVRRARRPSR